MEQVKKFRRLEVTLKARTVASMETFMVELEKTASNLSRQIAAEEDRTDIKDRAHIAYSTFARAARTRQFNLLNSVADLKLKIEIAKREVAQELCKLARTSRIPQARSPTTRLDRRSAVVG